MQLLNKQFNHNSSSQFDIKGRQRKITIVITNKQNIKKGEKNNNQDKRTTAKTRTT